MPHEFSQEDASVAKSPQRRKTAPQRSDTARRPKRTTRRRPTTRRQPRYHVILWDDNEHTYEFVIHLLQSLFGYQREKGFNIAREVDTTGRAVCLTTTLEHAELKRDQIHAFGRDMRIDHCSGAMKATIEPETD
jgi:ATP-dependent Clp protease adaptor protein ClpS